MSTYLKWLDETGIDELELVGGKNASLGEMIKNLKHLNIKVPYGFVVTADSYDYFMIHNNLVEKIQAIINETNIDDFVDLKRNSLKIRNLIVDGEIPDTLKIDMLVLPDNKIPILMLEVIINCWKELKAVLLVYTPIVLSVIEKLWVSNII